MTATLVHRLRVVAITVGFVLTTLSCASDEREPLAGEALLHYSGTLVTHVEQPESVEECGREFITYDTSGFVTVDHLRNSVRLEGLACTLRVDVTDASVTLATPSPCVADGTASFRGVGIDELRFESFELNLDAGSTSWRARAFRNVPTGRVAHCLDLDGELKSR